MNYAHKYDNLDEMAQFLKGIVHSICFVILLMFTGSVVIVPLSLLMPFIYVFSLSLSL